MKLANLSPLTPGFVYGLTEKQGAVDKEDEHLGAADGPERDKKQSMKDRRKEMRGEDRAKGDNPAAVEEAVDARDDDDDSVDESHGRGRGETDAGYGATDPRDDRGGARLREEDGYDEHELENAEDDLDHAADLEVDAEEDLGDIDDELAGPGREVSVDDFLAALETALESVLGDEVEVDQEEVEVEEDPLEDEMEIEMGVEEEPELDALQEMVNEITKRVAKRLVKQTLS